MNLKVQSALKQAAYAAIIYIVGIVVTCLVTPHTGALAPYKIPMSSIYWQDAGPYVVPNRFAANPTTQTATSQFTGDRKTPKRFHFRFDEDWPVASARMIYIPSSGGETRVFMNGGPIPVSQPAPIFAPGFGTNWIGYDVARDMMVPGTNRLDIHLQSDPVHGGIREIYFAPRANAARVIKHQALWMDVLPVVVAVGAGLVIVFALAGLAYGRNSLNYLLMGCLGVTVLFQGSLTYLGDIPPFEQVDYAFRVMLPLIIIALLAALWKTGKSHVRRNSPTQNGRRMGLYALAFTGPILAFLAMVFPVVMPMPLQVATLSLAGPLVLLLPKSAASLSVDMVARRSRIAQLRATVSAQAEALDEKSQLIAKSMQKQAVLEERQRFTRDIHDGIGGQLLSLLLRVRTGKIDKDHISEEIQQGLNDLRLVVDSMDHTGDDLTAALTTFRIRAESQMKAAKIALKWEQPEVLVVYFPTSRGTLNLYRFMQETLTNIVRHAKADAVLISLSQSEDTAGLIVRICDNGIGMPAPSEITTGRGLKNLESRAQALDGTLRFMAGLDGRGTTVELSVPMRR